MVRSGAARLTTPDWVVVGAGLLAYIASFLPWYTTWYTANAIILSINGSASVDAWHAGAGAWSSVLLLMLASVLMLVSTLSGLGTNTSRSLITLGVSVLAFITLLLHWVTFPDTDGGLSGRFGLGGAFTVSSAGVGLYLGLISTIAAVLASLLTLRAIGRSTAS